MFSGTKSTPVTLDAAKMENPLWTDVLPFNEVPAVSPGSTEVGDVSQITPTAQIWTTCWPFGTPPHSWQTVASTGTSIGFKGMLYAAKVMGLAGLELMTNPEKLAAARAEFEQRKNGKAYVSPIPDGVVPH